MITFSECTTYEELEYAYRQAVKHVHPDAAGGSHEAFLQLQAAYTQRIRELQHNATMLYTTRLLRRGIEVLLRTITDDATDEALNNPEQPDQSETSTPSPLTVSTSRQMYAKVFHV